MKLFDANKARWVGGVCIGIVIGDTFRSGWGGLVLLILGLVGRWLLGKLASVLFDEEIQEVKSRLWPSDPVKQAIWRHTLAGHDGRFVGCTEPACTPPWK